ncbi:Hypothetical protein I596_828 [Dokdonella koreensis DS-123]|uniref:DUF4785 family protein n=2 Tax=Dokdonella TaxID=323413 RepID=A0A160DS39_9GAMM|nr:Hypothetical protein I596_828 [Dokdonella koreensis DS-123]
MMKTTRFAWPALLLAVAAQAQPAATLLPAAAGDLVAGRAVAVERSVPATLERAPLTYAQPLAAGDALAGVPAIHVAESREYWQRVDGVQLGQGYALALTAPGALVLLSPAASAAPLATARMRIVRGAERTSLDRAGEALVDAAALREAGMAVAAGSIGFRLRPGYEADARLQVDGAQGDYLLHVTEPRSPHRLTLAAARDTVHAGDELIVDLALLGGAQVVQAAGLLVAPDGRSWDLAVSHAGNGVQGRVSVPSTAGAQPGLWEVRTTLAASDGTRAFQRDARTALAVTVPTARIAGAAPARDTKAGRSATTVAIDLDVASAGRYEVRGILYGTDAGGRLVPAALAQSAAWMEPGARRLDLAFPPSAGGLRAPYELRDLRLTDQGVPALIERRARALALDR